ncbi:hypothetical protein FQN54_003614 [Arachnomyces sp. PD_36]|nr:hypothetical protein FQN54_003614 [Arachnomyces sp. PD_36]
MSTTKPTPPSPSALTSLLSTHPSSSSPSSQTPTSALTLQTLHNLQHQHLWTSLRTHPPHTLSKTQTHPLISGLPPHRIYTHPDEQAYMLEKGIREEDVSVEREWVLPVAQGEEWSLRKLAGGIDAVPERWGCRDGEGEGGGDGENGEGGEGGEGDEKDKKLEEFRALKREGKWGGKRLLLGMVNKGMGGDGTVVYYVVNEGSVKPRQN